MSRCIHCPRCGAAVQLATRTDVLGAVVALDVAPADRGRIAILVDGGRIRCTRARWIPWAQRRRIHRHRGAATQ